MSKEAMKLALEALKELTDCGAEAWGATRPCVYDGYQAIKALEEALAKQEQRNDSEHLGEPVALTWNKKMDAVQAMLGITSGELDCLGESLLETYANDVERVYKALCTAPQQRTWVGLNWSDLPDEWVGNHAFMEGAKWAEAKLKEKNA